MKPSDRISEASNQILIARDELDDVDDELPEGVVEELGTISERLRRVRNAVEEGISE